MPDAAAALRAQETIVRTGLATASMKKYESENDQFSI